MRYRMGEDVRICSKDRLQKVCASQNVLSHAGRVATIIGRQYGGYGCYCYMLSIDNGDFWWTDDLFEPIMGFCEVGE